MKIPILLYHALFDKDKNREKYALYIEEFEGQIKYLYENGFQSILSNAFYNKNSSLDINKKYIIITFDDGNYSDYSIALPILKKYGFGAVFFITTNWIGTKNYLTWSDLKEMAANGMSIQSHSMSHSFLSDLNPAKLYEELNKSKDILSENLNVIVDSISLPGGFCSQKVLNTAEDVDYKIVYTSVPGLNILNFHESEFTVLNRFVMTRKTPFEVFKAIVNGDRKQIAMYKLQHYLKSSAKKLLGSKRYYAIWSKFFREI